MKEGNARDADWCSCGTARHIFVHLLIPAPCRWFKWLICLYFGKIERNILIISFNKDTMPADTPLQGAKWPVTYHSGLDCRLLIAKIWINIRHHFPNSRSALVSLLTFNPNKRLNVTREEWNVVIILTWTIGMKSPHTKCRCLSVTYSLYGQIGQSENK